MKKLFSLLLVLALGMGLAACGSSDSSGSAAGSSSGAGASGTSAAVSDKEKKTCLISDSSMAADFDQVIWRGFTMLEANGWEVKCIEALDKAEYEEDIYAMAAAGYKLIYIKGDAIASVLIDIADEFHAMYPDVYFILVDSYIEHDLDFATAVPVDPYESSFMGGYVAALMSQTKEVGWIGHMDTVNLARFRNGFIAGAQYAVPECKVAVGFTGDFYDPIKGQEATYAMHENSPNVDIIAHAAYISGNGVLSACSELGIPCIGCDAWQGDKGDTVFWSTLKSVDLMVFNTANRWLNNEESSFGPKMSFNIAAGSVPYDTRDLSALPQDVQDKVQELMEGIKSGSIDVFYGDYAEYKLDY
ncbi:BMP family ABC transporter substrate-binding protein [Anaerofilum sp. BX8]|uniref:BMP family ABC transporter substrate-binding protein n=1 Tax=Anaerofilum hominis TaxID=2763016 RepID=A0A923I9I0_9FIRM|nr:BMP family ABC transporter substrate-binding protein [Anaerofilum hominis]MBC5581382.1 BMP family ABC transporter substrate-binding protein [Anaerofilum hominis]